MDSADRTNTFVRLLAQHQRGVYALILSIVPNWSDADDILQQTNVRLWEQFDKYVSGTDFGAWARTVAKFQVMTYRRKQQRVREQFTGAFLDRVAEISDAEGADAARHDALSECLERLPERSRTLLRSYYAPGAVAADVATGLGRTVESVRLTLFRIRRALRDCINQRMDTRTP